METLLPEESFQPTDTTSQSDLLQKKVVVLIGQLCSQTEYSFQLLDGRIQPHKTDPQHRSGSMNPKYSVLLVGYLDLRLYDRHYEKETKNELLEGNQNLLFPSAVLFWGSVLKLSYNTKLLPTKNQQGQFSDAGFLTVLLSLI